MIFGLAFPGLVRGETDEAADAQASAPAAVEVSSASVLSADLLSLPPADVLPALHRLYAPVTNLTCSVRRTTSGSIRHSVTLISNVAYARGDHLNVETISPIPRRIVIDGANLHARRPEGSGIEVTPVADLPPSLLANLRSVPASPEELLAAVDPASAADLPPDALAARQIAYGPLVPDAPAQLTILSLDESGLVLSIAAYASSDRSVPLASTTFSAPTYPLPGIPLYQRQETQTSDATGVALRTVSRFDSIRVNIPLPASLFDPAAFF